MIRASNGEFVLRAAAVQKYGLAMVSEINSLRYSAERSASRASAGSASVATAPGLSDRDVARIAAAVERGSASGSYGGTKAGVAGQDARAWTRRRTGV